MMTQQRRSLAICLLAVIAGSTCQSNAHAQFDFGRIIGAPIGKITQGIAQSIRVAPGQFIPGAQFPIDKIRIGNGGGVPWIQGSPSQINGLPSNVGQIIQGATQFVPQFQSSMGLPQFQPAVQPPYYSPGAPSLPGGVSQVIDGIQIPGAGIPQGFPGNVSNEIGRIVGEIRQALPANGTIGTFPANNPGGFAPPPGIPSNVVVPGPTLPTRRVFNNPFRR